MTTEYDPFVNFHATGWIASIQAKIESMDLNQGNITEGKILALAKGAELLLSIGDPHKALDLLEIMKDLDPGNPELQEIFETATWRYDRFMEWGE